MSEPQLTQCKCMYNRGSALAKAKSGSAAVPAKRTGELRDRRDGPDPKKTRVEEVVEDLEPVVPERAIDETTQRRFRE